MSDRVRRAMWLACGVIAFGEVAAAQVIPVVLISRGDAIGPNNATITSINSPAINAVGGFVIRARTGNANSNDPSLSTDFVYGRLSSATSAGILLNEGPIGPLTAQAFGAGFYLTDSQSLGYNITSNTTSPFRTALLLNGAQLALAGDSFPTGLGYDGRYWGRSLVLCGVNSVGDSYILTSANTTASLPSSGETAQVLLRRSANGTFTKLLYNGASVGVDSVSPETSASGTNPIGGVNSSRDGTQWVASVDVNPTVYNATSNPFPVTEELIKNGVAATTASGTIIKEGNVLTKPDCVEGGETISSFGNVSINNSGSTAFNVTLGGTSPSTRNEAIMVNGRIRFREGQFVAGQQLGGLVNTAYLNNNDDLLWSYSSAGGSSFPATLFLNDERIAYNGLPVDTDGDGFADSTLTRFFEAIGTAISERDSAGNVSVAFLGATDESGSVPRLFKMSINLVGSKWNLSTGGTWVAGSFTGGLPDAVGARASFTNPLSAPGTVTLATGRTVGAVTFDSAQPYTLSGSTLTLNNGGNQAAIVRVLSGSHTINTPVVVSSPELSVRVDQAASVLTFGQNLAVGGAVYKVGAGRMDVPKLTAGFLEVDDGELRLTRSGQLGAEVGSLTITDSGLLNLGTTTMVVHNGDEAALRTAVARWWASGERNGSGLGAGTTSTFVTVAIFPNTTPDGSPYFSSFFGLNVVSSDIIARATYVGDTNLDGVVNGTDLANLIEGLSTGATGWASGDVNYDGVVSAADLTLLTNALNAGLPSLGAGDGAGGGGGSVPEPASLGVALASASLLTRRRR